MKSSLHILGKIRNVQVEKKKQDEVVGPFVPKKRPIKGNIIYKHKRKQTLKWISKGESLRKDELFRGKKIPNKGQNLKKMDFLRKNIILDGGIKFLNKHGLLRGGSHT
ncbi:unnamed protein product [Dovyalis caffra]|uniref:Uncharacterized protein n=1 Tax=Dovyalis caffra TaxID=77055 RepID=A0AAV1RD99_9ROSI|nr:unnamed protein product [Dovyalis caffra]